MTVKGRKSRIDVGNFLWTHLLKTVISSEVFVSEDWLSLSEPMRNDLDNHLTISRLPAIRISLH